MHPVTFPGSNVVLAKDQPEYLPLPAHVAPGAYGIVTTCWELTDEDLAKIIETRKVWCSQYTFNTGLQPQLLTVETPEF